MKTEKDKMLRGELYDALDPQLSSERRRARLLIKKLNDTLDDPPDERANLIKALIPTIGTGVWIEPPFFCDYGSISRWAIMSAARLCQRNGQVLYLLFQLVAFLGKFSHQ